MTVEHTRGIANFIPRYTRYLVLVLVVGFLIYWSLLAINPDLGSFTVVMLLNIAIVGLLGVVCSVQAIRHNESWRWFSYLYLLLVISGILWAIIDM